MERLFDEIRLTSMNSSNLRYFWNRNNTILFQ